MEEATSDKTTSGDSSVEVSIPIIKPPVRPNATTATKSDLRSKRSPTRFKPWLVALFSAVLLAGGWGAYQHIRHSPADDENPEFAELEGFEEFDSKLGVATADGTVPNADDEESLSGADSNRARHLDRGSSSSLSTARHSNERDDTGLVIGNGRPAAWLSGTIESDEGDLPGSRPATRLSGGSLDGPILR